MPLSPITPEDYIPHQYKGAHCWLIEQPIYDRFDSGILQIGSTNAKPEEIEGVAAVFDLAGFTEYCSQENAHYFLSKFLNKFLDWIMENIRNLGIRQQTPTKYLLRHPAPAFVKFTGDGLILLWHLSMEKEAVACRIVKSLYTIVNEYKSFFLESVEFHTHPPKALRCGIFRGKIYSIGGNFDYVGSCINKAAKLQKLPGISFAFSPIGIRPSKSARQWFEETFILKYVALKKHEIRTPVYIRRDEYQSLSDDDDAEYFLRQQD